jgi:hypothetical protein
MKKSKEDAQQKAWAKIVAKAWSDEVFKQRLLKNPEAVFQEYGFDTPKGVTFKIHENTNKVIHITLPAKPTGDLAEEELRIFAGGARGCGQFSCHIE